MLERLGDTQGALDAYRSAFTADPNFRHIIAQQQSTFSLLTGMDQGYWIVLNLHKGRLGDQAATLGSLFLTTVKNALFSRKSRELFSIYCDEIQNLVAFYNEKAEIYVDGELER